MSATDLSLSKMEPLNFESDMITINVGIEKRKRSLHVHKDLICARSPFFNAALTSEWKEAQEGIVALLDDSYEIVTIYIQWLYRNKLFHRENKEVKGTYMLEMDRLTTLYLFAEKIQDANFKDTVIDAIIARVHIPVREFASFYPGADTVSRLYNNTVESSPVRRLLVDFYVWHANKDWQIMKSIPTLPVEFLRDITAALIKTRPIPAGVAPDKRSDTCGYHQHTIDGTPCYKKTTEPSRALGRHLDLRGPPQRHDTQETGCSLTIILAEEAPKS